MARAVRVLALAWVPMLGALVGALVDQRLRLGVTVWRSACRESGLALRSIAKFTLELLPCAVIGALMGGLIVLALALYRGGAAHARHSLVAHAGCVLAMPVGLLLCAVVPSWPLMLAAEGLLATVIALVLLTVIEARRGRRMLSSSVSR